MKLKVGNELHSCKEQKTISIDITIFINFAKIIFNISWVYYYFTCF